MKFTISLALLLAVMCAFAATASAGGSLVGKQIAALQKQSKAQGKEIAALSGEVATLKNQVAESGGGALTEQVTTLQSSVTTLQGSVATVSATLTCRYAQLATLDLGFIDIFALLVDEAEPDVGQVVPDNGACAQVGLTPPAPAAGTLRAVSETPAEMGLQVVAFHLGVLRP
jgi:uncharacterized protein YlxW (UPF0749 family)